MLVVMQNTLVLDEDRFERLHVRVKDEICESKELNVLLRRDNNIVKFQEFNGMFSKMTVTDFKNWIYNCKKALPTGNIQYWRNEFRGPDDPRKYEILANCLAIDESRAAFISRKNFSNSLMFGLNVHISKEDGLYRLNKCRYFGEARKFRIHELVNKIQVAIDRIEP